MVYVGLTRARHALWLAGGALPGFDQSPLGPMLKDADALAGPEIGIVRYATDTAPLLPRLPPEQEQPPAPPRSARRRIVADWWVHSFTQLARQDESTLTAAHEGARAAEDEAESLSPKDASPFSGPRFGNTLHAVLETTAFDAWADWQPGEPAPATQTSLLREALSKEGYLGEQHTDGLAILTPLIGHTLTTALPEGGSLSQLPQHQRRNEMEFHFDLKPTAITDLFRLLHAHGIATTRSGFGPRRRLEGLMTGKIDLTYLGQDGRWYVLDYKSNQLPAYHHAALNEAMAHSQYDLQALIYTLALHRWLRFRLQDAYAYERDFGGLRYLFCRGLVNPGEGLYAHRFAPELVHALDALLAGPGRAAA